MRKGHCICTGIGKSELKLLQCFRNIVCEGQWQRGKSWGWMELSAIEFFIMKILNTIYPILCLVFREIKKKISNTHSMLVKVLVAQLCLTLCSPMNYSPPGSSVPGILQARILEWVAILFSRGSSLSSDQTQVSCIDGSFFTTWATREALVPGKVEVIW